MRASVAGIVCGFVGPFGSYPANLFTRLAYWTGLFWIGTVLLWPAVTVAIGAGVQRGVPPALAGSAAGLACCIPLAAIAARFGGLLWPVHASGVHALEWYGQTVFMALPALAIMIRLEGVAPFDTADKPSAAGISGPVHVVPAPVQGSALPPHLIEGVLCLQMEDHHVRIYTDGRSYLHLAPLREAMAALGEGRGLQVHRSWWVARNAVRSVQAEGRARSLILANGLRVPVARSRVAILRDNGWLDEVTGPTC